MQTCMESLGLRWVATFGEAMAAPVESKQSISALYSPSDTVLSLLCLSCWVESISKHEGELQDSASTGSSHREAAQDGTQDAFQVTLAPV